MLIIIFIPDKYFSATSHQLSKDRKKENEKQVEVNTYFYDNQNKTELQNVNRSNISTGKNCINEFYQVISKPIFLLCNFTLACLFFILTVIQFQGTDYMEIVIGEKRAEPKLICFAIICLTSPTLGILTGSFLINYQGGYETRHSILICLISSIISGSFTIPATLATNLYMFTLFLWFVLFFGAAIVPPLNGIIMSSLPKELIGTANSIVIMVCNLFGFFPAPFLYAIIKDLYHKNREPKKQEEFAMKISLYYSMFGVLLLFIATIVRYKVYDQIYSEKVITEGMLSNDRNASRQNTVRAQSKTFIIQYMNGMVSGIEEDVGNIQGFTNESEKMNSIIGNPNDMDMDKKFILFNDEKL